jgi:hypothetical protein
MSEQHSTRGADIRMAAEFLLVQMKLSKEDAATFNDAVLNNPNGPGAASIIAGLLDLGTALVGMLAEARGAVTDDDRRKMAGEILRGLPDNVA